MIQVNKITLLKAITPSQVNKQFKADGTKVAVANVSEGIAKSFNVETAKDMAAILAKVTETTHYCIIPGVWKGDDGEQFRVITDENFVEVAGHTCTEIADVKGQRLAARKKKAMNASSWVLLDMDEPEGMPDEWTDFSVQKRCEQWETMLPGISTCERIELRGSSERVVGYGSGRKTHAWIRISHPEMLLTMREFLKVETVVEGLSFESPRYSRQTLEKVGRSHRAMFDLAVFDPGRLVFCARPTSELGEVLDAGIEIVNEGGGVLDVSNVKIPTWPKLRLLEKQTGDKLHIKQNGTGITCSDFTTLRSTTAIETQSGEEVSLTEIVSRMIDAGVWTMRCQTPFRASSSMAGVIFLSEKGVNIYDHGSSCSYYLNEFDPLLGVIQSHLTKKGD